METLGKETILQHQGKNLEFYSKIFKLRFSDRKFLLLATFACSVVHLQKMITEVECFTNVPCLVIVLVSTENYLRSFIYLAARNTHANMVPCSVPPGAAEDRLIQTPPRNFSSILSNPKLERLTGPRIIKIKSCWWISASMWK